MSARYVLPEQTLMVCVNRSSFSSDALFDSHLFLAHSPSPQHPIITAYILGLPFWIIVSSSLRALPAFSAPQFVSN